VPGKPRSRRVDCSFGVYSLILGRELAHFQGLLIGTITLGLTISNGDTIRKSFRYCDRLYDLSVFTNSGDRGTLLIKSKIKKPTAFSARTLSREDYSVWGRATAGSLNLCENLSSCMT